MEDIDNINEFNLTPNFNSTNKYDMLRNTSSNVEPFDPVDMDIYQTDDSDADPDYIQSGDSCSSDSFFIDTETKSEHNVLKYLAR